MNFFEIFTKFGDGLGKLTGLFWARGNLYFVCKITIEYFMYPS